MRASFRPVLLVVAVLLPALSARAQTGVADDRVSLPDGPGSLRGVGESAAVNANPGLLNYDIALELPPGFPVMTPALSLSYSSGAGSSVLGIGWSLPEPSIERMTRRGLPEYD